MLEIVRWGVVAVVVVVVIVIDIGIAGVGIMVMVVVGAVVGELRRTGNWIQRRLRGLCVWALREPEELWRREEWRCVERRRGKRWGNWGWGNWGWGKVVWLSKRGLWKDRFRRCGGWRLFR